MKSLRLIPLVIALLLGGCAVQSEPGTTQESDPAFSYSFTDDTGTDVTLAKRPEHVAVLLSSLADLWQTAGGTADITVGETVERGYADTDVVLVDDGAGKQINTELLVASVPDFVLYSAELAGQLECAESLRAAGIPAAGFCMETFEDYLRVLKICTDLTGQTDRYETYGVKVRDRIETMIGQAQSQTEQPKILFVRAGSKADYTKAKTAENNFVCAMLKELGTVNIAEKAPVLLDGLSTEEVLLADPDAILFTTMGDEESAVAYMQSLLDDPVWKTLSAVKSGKVYCLPKNMFQYKPNARWDEAYAYLIGLLYGETAE